MGDDSAFFPTDPISFFFDADDFFLGALGSFKASTSLFKAESDRLKRDVAWNADSITGRVVDAIGVTFNE